MLAIARRDWYQIYLQSNTLIYLCNGWCRCPLPHRTFVIDKWRGWQLGVSPIYDAPVTSTLIAMYVKNILIIIEVN